MAFNEIEEVGQIVSGDPSKSLKVQIVEITQFKAAPRLVVDIREWVTSPNYTGPTKKGVILTEDEVDAMISTLQEGKKRLAALGKERASKAADTSKPPAAAPRTGRRKAS